MNNKYIDGRRVPFGTKKYDLKSVSSRQHEILRMVTLGMTNKQVAERLGCSPQTVSIVRNSSLGRLQLEIFKQRADEDTLEVSHKLRSLAPGAIATIEALMTNEEAPSAVRLNAAKDLLDRAGYAAERRMSVRSTSVQLSPDDLANLRNEALERARENGLLVETDIAEDEQPQEMLPPSCQNLAPTEQAIQ